MMHGFAVSDESSDSDDNEHGLMNARSKVEPLNWYIADREWSTAHVSREANRSPRSRRHANNWKDNDDDDDDEQSDSKIQECADRLRKKCHFRSRKKNNKFKKCCTCCCQKTSETSTEGDERSQPNRTRTRRAGTPKKRFRDDEESSEEEKKVRGKSNISTDKKMRTKAKVGEKDKKNKRSKEKKKGKLGKKHLGKTGADEMLAEMMITAGASADITKSCCYLCAQNSMAIVGASRNASRPSEQLRQQTRGTQVSSSSDKPRAMRTVQSSVKVRTCDRSTYCHRSGKLERKTLLKLKNFKALSKYVKKMWPAEKTVACGSDTPIKKRTKKTCGTHECRRYASHNL